MVFFDWGIQQQECILLGCHTQIDFQGRQMGNSQGYWRCGEQEIVKMPCHLPIIWKLKSSHTLRIPWSFCCWMQPPFNSTIEVLIFLVALPQVEPFFWGSYTCQGHDHWKFQVGTSSTLRHRHIGLPEAVMDWAPLTQIQSSLAFQGCVSIIKLVYDRNTVSIYSIKLVFTGI